MNPRGRKSLAISYGRAKVLNIKPSGKVFEVRVIVPEAEVARLDPERIFDTSTFKNEYEPLALVYIRTGNTPALTAEEYESGRRGLAIVREVAKGSRNPHHGHKNSLLGPWLKEFCEVQGRPIVPPDRGGSESEFPGRGGHGEDDGGAPNEPEGLDSEPDQDVDGESTDNSLSRAPRFTVRGPLERFGKNQWNVLVRNDDELRVFWAQNQVATKIDWAGKVPKATISRKELVARCEDAGEGAEVEYDLEIRDRANGRGVAGVEVRVVAPPAAEDSERPEG